MSDKLKLSYAAEDDIPEAFRSLYSVVNGKYELTGVEGVKLPRPDTETADRKPSPWSAKGWSLARQGQFVKDHGIDRAHAEAARWGCKVGSTRPNPAYS
jgi:hypothetical protein